MHARWEDLRKMPSKLRNVREAQKEYYETAIEKRRSLLTDKGVDKARMRKDPHLKHLQAGLRKTLMRLRTVEALEKQKEALALRKQERLEKKKTAKSSKAPEQGKKKPKKEKKKTDA
jgi:hypothetical protein